MKCNTSESMELNFIFDVIINDIERGPVAGSILIAFITGNSSLEPLIEGLCAQIHVNLR